MAAARKPRKAAKGHKLPESIPELFVINDTTKKSWTIGKEIGSGGFGTVYYAAETKNPNAFDFVVKIEYHDNGPLFAEMHCYQKIGKPIHISEWMKKEKLKYLGLSPCYGIGSFEFNSSKYRFMVLERYGKDLQKMLEDNGNTFSAKTAYLIGISVINVLEYIHSSGYVHGDIKAANLLIGRKKGTEHQIYLVDMGLACKYSKDGVHKKDAPDAKKAHNGTIEFASRDAHRGTFARRSDLEILCYNLLHWLTGNLPWVNCKTPVQAQGQKNKCMDNIPQFIKTLFPDGSCPKGIKELLEYVSELSFEEEPDYTYCRKQLLTTLKQMGCNENSTLDFTIKKPAVSSSKPPVVSNKENVKVSTSRATTSKRKEKAGIYLAPDIVPTPAMLEILQKDASSGQKTKTRRK